METFFLECNHGSTNTGTKELNACTPKTMNHTLKILFLLTTSTLHLLHTAEERTIVLNNEGAAAEFLKSL